MSNPRTHDHEPSPREKCNKVRQAIEGIDAGNILIINDRHNALAMDFLGAEDMEQVLDWVRLFLDEITEIGPEKCFVNRYAKKCQHAGFQNIFLFAYHWYSPSFGKRVYLKFGIKTLKEPDGKLYTYCHLDCHEDQP